MPSRLLSVVFLSLSLSRARGAGVPSGQLTDLVTFGDSYTDVVNVGDGGVAWPVYAAGYANVSLHPFARSGATCSNDLTPRPAPSLLESQLPTYFAETMNGTLSLDADKTMYTLWIGTNDLGQQALLTENLDVTLAEVTDCMVSWVKTLYDNGARNFLFQNMIPLEKTILYAADGYLTGFYPWNHNMTEWAITIRDLTHAGNDLTQLKLQALVPSLSGAHVGIFDSHGLFSDMIANPGNYLNGTAPLNVTGAARSCVYQDHATEGDCTEAEGTDRDSYLWWDELHPSEQADRKLAEEIAEVIGGQVNEWTTWLS